MKNYGAFEAKVHFSHLLAEVERGEIITITKHGKPIAILSPMDVTDSVSEAIQILRMNRKGVKLGKGISIRKMIEAGRK